jgi:hypothetical protein
VARKKLRRRFLVIAGAAFGVLVILPLAAIAAQGNNTVSVGVTNDSPVAIRLSACPDDTVDLKAGESDAIDVSWGRLGCPVYVLNDHDIAVYQGCLILTSGDAGRPPGPIFAHIDKALGDNSCLALH